MRTEVKDESSHRRVDCALTQTAAGGEHVALAGRALAQESHPVRPRPGVQRPVHQPRVPGPRRPRLLGRQLRQRGDLARPRVECRPWMSIQVRPRIMSRSNKFS